MKRIIVSLLTILLTIGGLMAQETIGRIVIKTKNPNSPVNVRTAPNTQSEVMGKVSNGLSFPLMKEENGWYRIKYQGEVGYVRSDLAERENAIESTTPSSTRPATATEMEQADFEMEQPSVNPPAKAAPSGEPAYPPFAHKQVKGSGSKVFDVADINDVAKVYRTAAVKENCFVVISKQEYRLYVYEKVGGDTLLAAHFPVCYARKTGPKTRTGDMSTPECSLKHPAYIMQIQDASAWTHDFKDGRGSFRAYGPWFMRLNLSKSDCAQGCRNNRSIGIHGSTGNAQSVPGNDSEGCIRLRDADLRVFHNMFARVGTPVVIKAYTQGKFPFEKKAEKACNDYLHPTKGYQSH